MPKFNYEMVTMARDFRGLTQQELADKMGVKQPYIGKLEAGLLGDAADELAPRLSEALSFPIEFFFIQEQRIGVGSSALYYRKRAKLNASDRKRIHALVNILRINIKKMLDAVELEPIRRIPKVALEDSGKTAQSVAQELRASWNIPYGPIKNVTALLEGAGILVVPCDFGTPDMDGTASWLNDSPPTIFINRYLPGDRWRHTLCHELAHLIMHDMPNPSMEDEADAFAAELLAPAHEIKADLTRIQPIRFAKLLPLKSHWKVSASSLIMRSRQLGLISPDQEKRLWAERGNAGGNNEPTPIELEKVQNLPNILSYFQKDLNFSVPDFEGMLKINRPELQSFFGVSDHAVRQKPYLRLVQ